MALPATVSTNPLESILSSNEAAAEFCKSRIPSIKFAMVGGRLCTSAKFIKDAGSGSVPQDVFTNAAKKTHYDGIEPEIVWIKTEKEACKFANNLGLSTTVFIAAFKAHGKVLAYSARVAAISHICSKPEARKGLIEWSGSAAALRRLLYSQLNSPLTKAKAKIPTSNVVALVPKQEVESKPAVVRPEWVAPANIAYTDASLWTEGGGCAIAAFHPHTMQAQVIYLPIPSSIDGLEMQAIALAHQAFGVSNVFTDSQNAVRQYGHLKAAAVSSKDKLKTMTGHLAYGLRDLATERAVIEWIPRTKNIVADAVAVWASRNKFTGRLNIEFTVQFNLANPSEVDTTKEWIRITPVVEKGKATMAEMVERLRDKQQRLELELATVNRDLLVLTEHADVFARYMSN
jgi:hypothetical protein